MNQNKINIVAFDVPYPANYGGVIDIFFKLKTLHEAGVEIILHCFQYGRSSQPELEKYCKQIFYYKRKKSIQYLFSKLPYIVISRNNINLLNNLKANNSPILFEGVHTCYFLNHTDLQKRQKVVRMHNVEHHYYNELGKATTNIFKKLYFQSESKKLKNIENILSSANCIATISLNDYNYFSKKHPNTKYIPAFHPIEKIDSKPGKGNYFLYHGNLSVSENEKAIIFLVDKVFSTTNYKFIVAGKSPTKKIKEKLKQHKNIQLIANPTEKEMSLLIRDAHCCVLPTFQTTGLKLKLLISLFSSRHIIVNTEMVENTGLESICNIANNAEEFVQKISEIKNLEFSQNDINKRKEILKNFYNKNIGEKLITIFSE